MGDLLRNMIGGLIALFFLLPVKNSLSKAQRITAKTIIVFLVATQIYPIMISLFDENQARRDFPVLSDFQTPFQQTRWDGDAALTIENPTDGSKNRSMRVDLTTQQYSGISLDYFPGNWSRYQILQFRINNPSAEPIRLTCRIHDTKHTQGVQRFDDRFNKSFSLSQGWHTVNIRLEEVKTAPNTRQMDMSDIRGLGIFATRLTHPRTIYIDDVKLLHSDMKEPASQGPAA